MAAILAEPDDWDLLRQSAQSSSVAWTFWSRVDATEDGCWPWEGRTDDRGYGRVGYQGRSNLGAHRVAWALTHGGDIPVAWVLHQCDNPPCVRPGHLFLGNATANNRDRQAKGRTRGWAGLAEVDHHAFKVTTDLAAAMVEMRTAGATEQTISDQFSISRGHVSKIIRGLTVASGKAL